MDKQKTDKINALIVDFKAPDNWDFLSGLEQSTNEKWKTIEELNTLNFGSMFKKIIRYGKYFIVPFKILLKKDQYKHVLTWQQFYGLILAFYFKIFRVDNAPQITVMSFIYKPKCSMIGKIYGRFMKYIVTSCNIKQYIIYSKNEKEYYADLFQVSQELFVPITLGIDDSTGRISPREKGEYFFTAGRSNRDYMFLIDHWK
ncbi:MAG: hypothetical protein Q4B57_07115, partial [Eubacteriales bacterium]|nr:hypothetical protein [Eubacteriales bacterium]